MRKVEASKIHIAHPPEGWLNFTGTVALTYRNYGSKRDGLFTNVFLYLADMCICIDILNRF